MTRPPHSRNRPLRLSRRAGKTATKTERGKALILRGVNSLIDQTRPIERVMTTLGLGQTGLDGSAPFSAT